MTHWKRAWGLFTIGVGVNVWVAAPWLSWGLLGVFMVLEGVALGRKEYGDTYSEQIYQIPFGAVRWVSGMLLAFMVLLHIHWVAGLVLFLWLPVHWTTKTFWH